MNKKPKVKPVIAKQAKLLKRAMKGMQIGEKKKIVMEDSSDSSSSDNENETMFMGD